MQLRRNRRLALQTLSAVAALWTLLPAYGAPRKRLLVTLSSGSGLDTAARRMSQILSEQHKIHIDIDNVPGGGGLLAVQKLLAAPADGQTLLLTNSGLINTVPEVVQDGPRFDPLHDLTPLATLLKTPFVLSVPPKAGLRSLADLQAMALRTRQPVLYGVAPLYGTNHVAGHLLFKRLGLPAKAVPYSQTSQLALDLSTGRLSAAIMSWGTAEPLASKGLLQPLVTLSRQRLPEASDLPHLGELGLGDAAHEGWVGIFHRPTVPAEALQPLAQALAKTISQSTALTDLGYLNFYKDAAAAAAFVREDVARHRMLLSDIRLS